MTTASTCGNKGAMKSKLEADLENIKKQILDNILELHYLKNEGHMHDYQAWIEKAHIKSIILQTKDEDIQNDERFSQLKNLSVLSETAARIPANEVSQPSPVTQKPPTTSKTTQPSAVQPIEVVDSSIEPKPKDESPKPEKVNSESSAQEPATNEAKNTTTSEPITIELSPEISHKDTSITPIEVDPEISTCETDIKSSISNDPVETPTQKVQPATEIKHETRSTTDLSSPVIVAPPSAKRPHREERNSSGKDSQSSTEYMAQALKRAKHEAAVNTRVNELRKQGLWSQKKLPKLQEPARPKTHWDYLLEEMTWLAADFAQERRWKKNSARKCARMVYKYHQDEQSKIERAQRDHLQHIKRLAAAQAKEIRTFWSTVEKVVDFRQQAKLEQTRKQALDLHLKHILDHTGKLSDDIQKSMVRDTSHRTSIDDQNESEPDATDDDVEMEVDNIPELESINEGDTMNDADASSIPSDNGVRGTESRNSVDVAVDNIDQQHRDSDYDSSIDEFNGNSNKNQTYQDSEVKSTPISDPNKQNSDIDDIAAGAESIQPRGNTLETTSVNTKVPYLLKHDLREYQHIGLDWLVAMYNKKLNGILADEMGLGKTIQTISLLAHLACEREDWGPHLIVVPTSVMLNWEMEFKKWCPAFKILTYYGSPKERRLKRQGWSRPNSFHVCITSYRIVIQDHAAFRRKKWKYLILDEAHYIKNFKSQRWQMLLNFNSERRLLLTGTPLQNDLMELWSLMHFLMPNLFDSCREFKDWFVNPVTGMIEGSNEYNDVVIYRLHKILRPFLLRRLKADVEKQLPRKHEYVKTCRLSKRQRFLYEEFMSLTQTKETLAKGSFFSVINVLMQLRKVCNHPNLFEPRPIVSPFMMSNICYKIPGIVTTSLDYKPQSHVNLSSLNLVFADIAGNSTSFSNQYIKSSPISKTKFIEEINSDDFSDSASTISRATSSNKDNEQNGLILTDSERLSEAYANIKEIHKQNKLRRLETMFKVNNRRCEAYSPYYSEMSDHLNLNSLKNLQSKKDTSVNSFRLGVGRILATHIENLRNRPALQLELLSSLIDTIIKTPANLIQSLDEMLDRFVICVPGVSANPISLHVSHHIPAKETQEVYLQQKLHSELSPRFNLLSKIIVNMHTSFPELRLIEYDCGKLQTLGKLLNELKVGDHRVLIFTQMSRMLDILEQFLNYHGHTYLRLDGSTKIDQRQILMERFNNDKKIFCFILSTRSGGIGVNLTGADTVIFYDSDWNPTMDAQAQDRCHRIGQTRDVHIYRLISEDTIEKNIFMKAQQKRMLGDLAIEGGNFNTCSFKRQAINELFGIEPDSNETVSVDVAAATNDSKIAEMSTDNMSKTDLNKLEMALIKGEADAGEDLDVDALKTARLDEDSTLREFDESIPLADEGTIVAAKSEAELKLETVISSMTPVERYAVRFLESLQKPRNREELEQTEKELRQQLENQKSLWEQSRIEEIKDESLQSNLGETLLTYPRDAKCEQVHYIMDEEQAIEEMPLWAPPTPPTSPPSPVDDARNNSYYFPAPQAMTPAMAARISAMGGLNILGFGNDSSAKIEDRQMIDEKDMYIDYTMHFSYESAVMVESQLPPVSHSYTENDITSYTIGSKKIRLNGTPVAPSGYLQTPNQMLHLQQHLQGFSNTTPDSSLAGSQQPPRKPKMRRDEVICLPRSLFDKQSPNFVRVRRELKLQKLRCVTKGNDSDPFAMQKFFHSFSLNPMGQALPADSLVAGINRQLQYHPKLMICYVQEQLPAWSIQEDWAMLLILQYLQDIPVNLCVLTPGHTPNWDFVSDVIGDVGFVFRSYKMCWYHFETVVQKREMTIDPKIQQLANQAQQQQQQQQSQQNQPNLAKKSKKQNIIEAPSIPFQQCKTGEMLKQDKAIPDSLIQRFQAIKKIRSRRKQLIKSNYSSRDRQVSNLQYLNITHNINYDSPLSPMQIAENKIAMIRQQRLKMQALKTAKITAVTPTPSSNMQPG